MEETKIIYYIDDEDTPYLIKLPIPADRVNLGDFKNALNRPNYKFFFKSVDDDFGVVKEEIVDDEAKLPCFNGRVVSWLVPAESSTSDSQSQCTDSQAGDVHLPTERVGGIGDSRPPSFHANASSVASRDQSCDTCTETDSVISSRRDRPRSSRQHSYNHNFRRPGDPVGPPRVNGHSKHHGHSYDSSTVLSSDIDTTSFFDTDDDSRFSTVTDTTNRTASKYGRQKRRQRRKHRMPPISRASSFSSITDSTMSLNVIVVTLNMDTVNFLGISIVGQSNKGGDGGIYVGSIMKGGAVAQDGRIEPGDMILEVNGISFENLSNDDAVRVLREAVQKPGPITLVVAKCWDPSPKGYFTVPRQEPVRPIDPSAWVAHTTAMQQNFMHGIGGPSPSISNMTSTSSSLTSSLPDSERFDDLNLTTNTDMATVVKAMAQPDSGLEIRDRMWLKITIPNAFIGSDLVDWLFTHLEGFTDRRDARKYACNLLKAGYIRHTVNKITFSEQCYYVFGDIYGNGPLYPDLSALSLEDVDSVSEADRDTLAPLPPPAWNNQYPYTNNTYIPQNISYIPPYSYTSTDSQSYIGSFVDGMDKNSTVGAGGVIGLSSIGNGGGNNSGGSVHSASVHNACCLPMKFQPAAQKLLAKTFCIDKEPNNNVRGKKSPQTHSSSKDQSKDNKDAKQKDDVPSNNNDNEGTVAKELVTTEENEAEAGKPGSSASGSSSRKEKSQKKSPGNSGSDSETASIVSARQPGGPPNSNLVNIPPDVSGSRQSFRMAMGNPCEFFVDVM
ncbi:segment polarity protein dishevelled homolog DVL-2-like isoform X1 [Mytilus californianus]|uniref:segment polarity protein dishevelled homolog DVL-2-like isoform X1 n=1 Tax=Mytilus californianus TaxID=6549 RepID=UPI0022484F16|nr:segment polarity protein dishevelled homolog DVL-2-like isoform X1 [Mytilus californianus]